MEKYLNKNGLNYLWQKIKYYVTSGKTGTFLEGTTGSIIYHNGNKWTSINKGLTGQILHSNGDTIEWKDASKINAVGYRYNTTTGAFAEGDRNINEKSVTYIKSTATGVMAHAEGGNCTASGRFSHAEGNATITNGTQSHAEGSETNAKGINSHAEGRQTITNGYAAHAEGDGSETGGNYSSSTTNPKTPDSRTASAGDYAHAEGLSTIAYGVASHSEGKLTLAKGEQSHAEGSNTTAQGNNSHAEGSNTTAQGYNSHAEGIQTVASGDASHTEGRFTQTLQSAEHAQGSYNKSHTDDTADVFGTNAKRTIHSIGIGTADDARKNAVEVMQNGDAYLLGVGKYDGVYVKGETGAPANLKTLQEVINEGVFGATGATGPQGEQGVTGSKYIPVNTTDSGFIGAGSNIISTYGFRIGDYSLSSDTNTIWVCNSSTTFSAGPSIKGATGPTGLLIGGALGSIAYHDGNTWTTLHKGDSGQVLKMIGTTPAWSTDNDVCTRQANSTVSGYSPLLIAAIHYPEHVPYDTGDTTSSVFFVNKAFVQPSSGNIYSAGYIGVGKTSLSAGCNITYDSTEECVKFIF